MERLPHDLYRADQVREMDRVAIEEHGIPGSTLMSRAGEAAFKAMRGHWPRARRIAVFCGSGNNGGDGYIVARLAHEAGLSVTLYHLGERERLGGDALSASEQATHAGLEALPYNGEPLDGQDLIVDALLGTGLSGEVAGAWRGAIESINASGLPVIALDIPSGLNADTGAVLGAAVKARMTVTFIALKAGLFTASGPGYCGELRFADLGVDPAVYVGHTPACRRIDAGLIRQALPARPSHSHKGDFGHVLVVGGNRGFAGAAKLAAEAAVRTGAGLVSIATHPEHAGLLSVTRPELMSHAIASAEQLTPLIRRASVIAIGPGLGQDGWARALLARVLESQLPLVLDADALNLLAADPMRHDNWVLTPHPGEAARLLGSSSSEVQRERFLAAASIEASYGGTVVLKGAGSIVQTEGTIPEVCHGGNPGMASGGMGDLLTGIIAGLVAQGLDLQAAARVGVVLHARAGDVAAQEGERGMLAADLLPVLRTLVNP